ncbi:MAG: hypothetical protein LBP51_02910 [Deferribacteraceae bacterium]|jgi:signal transduction histidine kinase|nr:hypothetical protein [Deferribacteraceae bacterium]
MPNAVIDIVSNGFLSPSEELCSFMGRREGELKTLKGWEKETAYLIEQAAGVDRTPRFVDIIKNGKPFHLGIFPLDFINLEKTHLAVFLFDAEKEAERRSKLEESFQALTVQAELVHNAVILSNDALILTASAELLNYWGFNLNDLLGKPFVYMLAASDKKRMHNKLLSSAAFSDEITALRKDGVQFKAVITVERRVMKRKIYIAVKVIGGTPFTEGLNSQYYNQHYPLLNFIPAMAAVGSNVELVYANDEFLNFFGCENLGDFFNRYGQLEPLFVPRKGYLHSKGGAWLSQAEYYLKIGSTVKVLLYSDVRGGYRTFSFSFKKILDSELCVFIFIDITDIDNRRFILQDVNQVLEQEVEKQFHEKHQAALLLKKQEELLVQQSKLAMMGNIVNIITHQWKQPLSNMRILSYNLLEDYIDGSIYKDKLDRYVRELTSQIEYMAETIDDFRNFFRTSRKLSIFEPAEPIKSVLRLLRPLLNASEIKVSFNANEVVPSALGFRGELKQVLMGVIINSIEALADKEGEIGEISIDITSDDSNIYITLEDNGGGIDPLIITKIFEPNITTKGDKGTGMGLYISQVAMANMNGNISVHNSPKGAVFTLTLKRAQHIGEKIDEKKD